YSLSVRRIDAMDVPQKMNTGNFGALFENSEATIRKQGETILLPELRGELIMGKVIQKDSGEPVANLNVALSVPGTEYVLKIANTDNKGIYYFNLNEHYS